MKTYEVTMTWTNSTVVEANSEEEAEEVALTRYSFDDVRYEVQCEAEEVEE